MIKLSFPSKVFLVTIFAVTLIFTATYFRPHQFPQSFRSKYQECSLLNTSRLRMDCFSGTFKKDWEKYGTQSLLGQLAETFIKDDHAESGGITKCHDAAHAIGMLAGMASINIQKTFASCTNLCGYGCHMGVIEGYFEMGHHSFADFPSICAASSHPYSCVHAVGHFTAHESDDLFTSLKTCDQIPQIDYRGHCTSGVFMELFEQPIHADTGIGIPQDITSFCNSLSGVHKSFCFTMSGYYRFLNTGDFQKGVDFCLGLSEGKDVCINNFSKALYYKENGSTSKMYDFCQKVPKNFLSSCQDGILMASVLSDPVARHGLELCNLYLGQERTYCFTRLGMDIEGIDGEMARKIFCNKLPEADRTFCLVNF